VKPSENSYLTRVEILLKKGNEELLPENLYRYSDSGLWLEEKADRILIRSYPINTEGFLQSLKDSGIRILEINIEKEEPQDYVKLTKQYFKPIKVEGIEIMPPWAKKRGKSLHIIIEPGMAFGTGRHESTAIMIRLMKTIKMNGKLVLDIGCGSGILSLYASLLGAKKVIAIDKDIDAVMSAKKNKALNHARKIQFICADLKNLKGKFEVVLANLDIQTFKKYSEHITYFLHNDGVLVISGVIDKDKKLVSPLFSQLRTVRIEMKNSWHGFVFKKE